MNQKRIITIATIVLFLLTLTSCTTTTTKLGVLSDIHGNTENLHYFLEKIKTEKVDAIIIAGDTVEHFRNNKSDYDELNQSLLQLSQTNLPIFIIPGNHENKNDYIQLLNYYSKKNKNIHDLYQEPIEKFKDITIIGLAGYENKKFLSEDGFLLENKQIENNFKLIQNNTNVLLITHGPPKGKNPSSIDALTTGENVGNLYLDQMMKQYAIKFSISGHIHEAGQKAVTEDDEIIPENKWSSSLRLNPGSVIPWQMNDKTNSDGSAAILEMSNGKVKYHILRE